MSNRESEPVKPMNSRIAENSAEIGRAEGRDRGHVPVADNHTTTGQESER